MEMKSTGLSGSLDILSLLLGLFPFKIYDIQVIWMVPVNAFCSDEFIWMFCMRQWSEVAIVESILSDLNHLGLSNY